MTSAINPDNIDGAYPVAGQDNNSQGFRDNFTNIITNFEYAADEITDLQSKAVLKAALTGTSLDNNMNDNLIYAAKIQDFSATAVAITGTSGSIAVNYAAGHYQTVTTAASIVLSFTNWPASSSFGWIRLQITVTDRNHTVTLPSAASVNSQGIQGLNTSTNVIAFAAAGVYTFEFATSNAGTTITVTEVNKRLQPFNNSSEDLASTAAANLAVTTSYFSTSAAETATLAAGVNGQIKTFAMYADSGDMVITVTNAAWGGSGTITFNAVGQACILQYINSKWFCVGNNGASFA